MQNEDIGEEPNLVSEHFEQNKLFVESSQLLMLYVWLPSKMIWCRSEVIDFIFLTSMY